MNIIIAAILIIIFLVICEFKEVDADGSVSNLTTLLLNAVNLNIILMEVS